MPHVPGRICPRIKASLVVPLLHSSVQFLSKKKTSNMSMNFEDCAKVRDGFPRPFPDTPSNVLDQFKMAGKVVVVTGAADGLGLSVAEGMAEAGANVAFWYNS